MGAKQILDDSFIVEGNSGIGVWLIGVQGANQDGIALPGSDNCGGVIGITKESATSTDFPSPLTPVGEGTSARSKGIEYLYVDGATKAITFGDLLVASGAHPGMGRKGILFGTGSLGTSTSALTFTSIRAGERLTVQILTGAVAGASASLAVALLGNHIQITPATTSGSVISSTADAIKAELDADTGGCAKVISTISGGAGVAVAGLAQLIPDIFLPGYVVGQSRGASTALGDAIPVALA